MLADKRYWVCVVGCLLTLSGAGAQDRPAAGRAGDNAALSGHYAAMAEAFGFTDKQRGQLAAVQREQEQKRSAMERRRKQFFEKSLTPTKSELGRLRLDAQRHALMREELQITEQSINALLKIMTRPQRKGMFRQAMSAGAAMVVGRSKLTESQRNKLQKLIDGSVDAAQEHYDRNGALPLADSRAIEADLVRKIRQEVLVGGPAARAQGVGLPAHFKLTAQQKQKLAAAHRDHMETLQKLSDEKARILSDVHSTKDADKLAALVKQMRAYRAKVLRVEDQRTSAMLLILTEQQRQDWFSEQLEPVFSKVVGDFELPPAEARKARAMAKAQALEMAKTFAKTRTTSRAAIEEAVKKLVSRTIAEIVTPMLKEQAEQEQQ